MQAIYYGELSIFGQYLYAQRGFSSEDSSKHMEPQISSSRGFVMLSIKILRNPIF